jgi:hypothetical protein
MYGSNDRSFRKTCRDMSAQGRGLSRVTPQPLTETPYPTPQITIRTLRLPVHSVVVGEHTRFCFAPGDAAHQVNHGPVRPW